MGAGGDQGGAHAQDAGAARRRAGLHDGERTGGRGPKGPGEVLHGRLGHLAGTIARHHEIGRLHAGQQRHRVAEPVESLFVPRGGNSAQRVMDCASDEGQRQCPQRRIGVDQANIPEAGKHPDGGETGGAGAGTHIKKRAGRKLRQGVAHRIEYRDRCRIGRGHAGERISERIVRGDDRLRSAAGAIAA